MKRNHFTVAILATVVSASSWAADVQNPTNNNTPSQQVQGTSASGEKQTTIVDEGGNLKIVETPKPTVNKPSTGSGAAIPSTQVPVTTPGMMQSNPQGQTPSTSAPSSANPSATTPATPPATAVPMQPGPVIPKADQNASTTDTQDQMLPPAQQAVPISQTPAPVTPSDNTAPLTNNQTVMPVQSGSTDQNQ